MKERTNIIMDNNAKAVYEIKQSDTGDYKSDVSDREAFKEGLCSIYCKISEVHWHKKDRLLLFGLTRPGGTQLTYAIVGNKDSGDAVIEHFIADVVDYTLDNSRKKCLQERNMLGKQVEVFFLKDNPGGILGVSPKSSYYVIGPNIGGKKKLGRGINYRTDSKRLEKIFENMGLLPATQNAPETHRQRYANSKEKIRDYWGKEFSDMILDFQEGIYNDLEGFLDETFHDLSDADEDLGWPVYTEDELDDFLDEREDFNEFGMNDEDQDWWL